MHIYAIALAMFIQTMKSKKRLEGAFAVGANAAALIVSAGKWFIPRRALICFARSVPRGRSLNTVAFAGNSLYSIRALQLYITVRKP